MAAPPPPPLRLLTEEGGYLLAHSLSPMISWIQRYFQKHIRLVMFIMLIIVGLPMVVIYSQSSGIGMADVKVRQQQFFNVNLANQEQASRVFSDGELSGYLRAGYPALQGAQLQQYALQRIAGLALADELHLPVPTDEQVSQYVQTLRAFQNPEGGFDQSAYTRFGDSLKSSGSPFTAAGVTRVLRDDTRLEALVKLVGGPGYVLPADVKQQLSRIDSTWTVQVASLDYTGFNPAINPTDEALKKFHEENAFRYDVPVRPRLSLVEFKAAAFAPPVGPTEEELRAFYNSNPGSFPVPAEAGKTDATPSLDAAATDNFPKVRAQVESTLRDLASRKLASQAANDLTVALFDKKFAPNSPELSAFLASVRLTAVPVTPFTPDAPPADRAWLGSYAEAISRLSASRPFSDALPTPDGFVVMLWNETLPAYQPIFTEVRERVLADYRATEKRRLFIERGNVLKAQLQAAGSPAAFAAAAAAEKLEVKTHANFTLRQPPQDLPQPALASLASLEAGQVSDLIGLGDKGLLVYVQEKKLPDLSPANPRYAEVQNQLMAFAASSNENAVLGALVEQELAKGNPDVAATP
jgi:peptidyl-prolyl cis-trans isomerase D